MASHADLDAGGEPVLALRSLQRPSDVLNAQIPRLHPGRSASAESSLRPTATLTDRNNDTMLNSDTSQRSGNYPEGVTQTHFGGSASAGNDTRRIAPHEDYEDDLELAIRLSKLPADAFDEQVNELNRRREVGVVINNDLASFPTSKPSVEVQTMSCSCLSQSLKAVTGPHASSCGSDTGLGNQ